MEPVIGGGISAGLMLVATFCWCWRHRCTRKTTLAKMDRLLAWERERRQEYHLVARQS
jgi:hypothetical protein